MQGECAINSSIYLLISQYLKNADITTMEDGKQELEEFSEISTYISGPTVSKYATESALIEKYKLDHLHG